MKKYILLTALALLLASFRMIHAQNYTSGDTMYVCHHDVAYSFVVDGVDSIVFSKPSAEIVDPSTAQRANCKIAFDVSEISLPAGESLDVSYTLTDASPNAVVKSIAPNGWTSKVIEATQTGGTIKVTAPTLTADTTEVVAFVKDVDNADIALLRCIGVVEPPAEDIHIIVADGVTIDMVRVAGGTFMMGGTYEQGTDAESDEKPTHEVTLSSFYIGVYEVTQELWTAIMGSNPSYFSGTNLPVENVTWNDCQAFIEKLNTATGKTFRMPTEAEWEYAARGGHKSKGYKYSGSDNIDDVAWYGSNAKLSTHTVGSKAPNELGIYDMSGNVFEWCQDWYGSYSSDAQTNPTGPGNGSGRITRGGGYDTSTPYCRCSFRLFKSPDATNKNYGLRLVLSE